MALRPELEPPAVDPRRRAALGDVIARIGTALAAGSPVDALMAEHDRLTGRPDGDPEAYREYWSHSDARDLAHAALIGPAPTVPDIARGELVEVARRILAGPPEGEVPYWLGLFERHTHGDSDLLYWPDPDWLARIGTDAPSPEQIVDEALRPRAIPPQT